MSSYSSSGWSCSESSNNSGSKGGKWTGCLHFWNDDNQMWTRMSADNLLQYFRDNLQAEEEIIIFSEIRKYDLWWWIPGLFGNWHEYTLVETTNWYWSFEKMAEGLFVQRSKKRVEVRCNFAGKKRPLEDRSEGRSSDVSYGENIAEVAEWFINRNELGNSYHVTQRNCHHFASLLYEAIVRAKGRRLDNTK